MYNALLVLAAVFLALISLCLCALLLAGTWLLLQLGRERRIEAEAERRAMAPHPSEDAPEATDEEKAARIVSLIDAAKDQNQMAKDDWRSEKLDEGWTTEEIEGYLAERPLLELN